MSLRIPLIQKATWSFDVLDPTIKIRKFRARDLARNRLEGKFRLLLKITDSQ